MPTDAAQLIELTPAVPPAPPALRESAKGSRDGEDAADATSALSPAKLLHAVRRNWLVAVPLAAAAAALVAWVAESRLTPIYTARTLVHVPAAQPSLVYEVSGRPETANYQRTQIATVKSRFVGQAAVKDLEPFNLSLVRGQSDPVAWLEKELQADYTVAPEILRITLKASDPDELLLVLNAVRDAYLREVLNKDRGERAARLQQLTDLAVKQDAAVKAQRERLANRCEALGGRDLTAVRVKYEHLTGQVRAMQTELLYYRTAVQRSEATSAAPPPEPTADPAAVESALEQTFAADPVADDLRKEITRLDKKLAEYKRRLRDYQNDPQYKEKAAELATAQQSLAQRRQDLRAAAAEQVLAAARSQRTKEAAGLERVTAAAKQYLPLLEAEIQQRDREAGELAKGITGLEALASEIARQEEQVKLVNSKMQVLEVELQAPPRARVLEEAVVVETPRWDRRVKYVAAPVGVTFLAVLLVVAWLDVRRGRVDGADDLEAGQIRVLGAVPSVRPRALQAFNLPDGGTTRRDFLRLTDAIDMTRAVIAPVLAPAPGYTLAVTSAEAGEGKTVLAGHLAARLARSGRRTLLIDTDVRRPRVQSLFGLRGSPGFGEWVRGQAALTDVAAPGPVPGLDIVPAGSTDPREVAELLDQRLPELLRSAKGAYDVIVLDTAPLLSAPESLSLGRAADGVVLSVMRDVSRLPAVLACSDRLLSINARVLGAVVTGDTTARYGSY